VCWFTVRMTAITPEDIRPSRADPECPTRPRRARR
jgi:hypothetical protein